jgi:hypothetical protein
MEVKIDSIVKFNILFNNSIILTFIAPGPGTYTAFSEFGIYRSKNADKFEASILNKESDSGIKNQK